jgi:hypothetical protein
LPFSGRRVTVGTIAGVGGGEAVIDGVVSLETVMKRSEENLSTEKDFYADASVLKEASQPYGFVSMPVTKPTYWIENCSNCRKPMAKVLVTPTSEIRGIVESVQGLTEENKKKSAVYKVFVENPVITSATEFWYCFECSSIWTIFGGFWVKAIIEGLLNFDAASIPRIGTPEVSVAPVKDPPPLDESMRPGPDSTPCPRCKIWREILPYDSTHVQHVCLQCMAVDLYRIPEVVPAST